MFFGPNLYNVFKWACPNGEDISVCLGISIVFRISLSLAALHLLMFLICLCRNPVTAALNDGALMLKAIIVIALNVGFLFIPNNVFKIDGYICMGASFLFLSWQLIILVDLAYTWNSKWVESYDGAEGGKCWGVTLIIFTVLFYGAGAALMVYCYFQAKYHNALNIIVISVTLVSGVGYTVLTLICKRSIFTSAILFLCTSCLCWSAIIGYNSTSTSNLDTLLQIFVGLGFLLLALFYESANTVTSEEETDGKKTLIEKANSAVAENVEQSDKDNAKTAVADKTASPPEVTMATALFSLMLMFASFYYAMVLTNWGSPYIGGHKSNFFVNPAVGFWIKLGSEWVVILLFFWSIIAPLVCRNREFE